jgi:starvation-inducible DNA-binding protein
MADTDLQRSDEDTETIHPNIGLNEEVTDDVVRILTTLLADEFLLYTKMRKYHWNVTGPQFFSLHELFERQYEHLADVIDDIAERIRTYGVKSIGTLEEFQQHSRLSESPGHNPAAHEMVADIVRDHEALVRYLRDDVQKVDDHDDDGAEDFLIGLLQDHQEQAWMVRAFLEGGSI